MASSSSSPVALSSVASSVMMERDEENTLSLRNRNVNKPTPVSAAWVPVDEEDEDREEMRRLEDFSSDEEDDDNKSCHCDHSDDDDDDEEDPSCFKGFSAGLCSFVRGFFGFLRKSLTKKQVFLLTSAAVAAIFKTRDVAKTEEGAATMEENSTDVITGGDGDSGIAADVVSLASEGEGENGSLLESIATTLIKTTIENLVDGGEETTEL
ncbi:ORF146 [White spot syndrome virus]|uniref:Wsv295 n=5 Tax=White spot syndrome virus TaxID=342409 RepID=Q77J29_WSSVS|nr:wsv295 [Shrimp white spot syndrome virus]YP_009220577.1 hypothetical protein SWSSV_gp103 [White spot syndrome virus]AYW76600.1 hypothetical protein [Procambarus clarkii virus]AAK77815.1 ORF146 [White spot syndrome virus]AAL24463.1 unknown [White spot syndrome virus]AAL33297.1 wsv295 [Shrimp white spot syndrome virus]AFX59672.1 wsv295 [White spot syndrome virus]